MLGKLLKYELKATARYFLPLYVALLALTLLNKLSISFDMFNNPIVDIIRTLLITAYVFVIICTTVITLILVVVRFYKNILTDEGYLTHTLPVKTSTHINCKILNAVIWNIISFFMQVISFIILLIGEGFFTKAGEAIGEFIDGIKEIGIFSNFIFTLVLIIIAIIISLVYSILMLYCAMSVGSLFRNHKIIGSIGAYFVINYAIQIISTIALMLFSKTAFFAYIDATMKIDRIDSVEGAVSFIDTLLNFFNSTIGVSCISSIICIVLFYIVSNFILSKKLNLD